MDRVALLAPVVHSFVNFSCPVVLNFVGLNEVVRHWPLKMQLMTRRIR